MILVLLLAGALATVPDVEVAAGSDAQADDYEGQDWEGNYQAQVYVGGAGAWCCEGHAGWEEGFCEDSGGGDGEFGAAGCWEVAVVADGFEDWKVSMFLFGAGAGTEREVGMRCLQFAR